MSQTGRIFDIRRFSVHDGDGIRTTIFFKGCPLACKWCQNPEGIDSSPHLFYFENKCIRCGQCVPACPHHALSPKEDGSISIDRKLCALCFACVDICPTRALAIDSSMMTSEEVVEKAMEDLPFFKYGGGVTLSGGEPLLQFSFALDILQKLKEKNVNTAVETALLIPQKNLAEALPYLNTVFADFKFFDSKDHKAATSVENKQILLNIDFLLHQTTAKVIIRTPMIPEFTATTSNITAIASHLAAKNPKIPYELLNYNPLAKGKYALLEEDYCYETNPPLYTAREMDAFRDIARKAGLINVF